MGVRESLSVAMVPDSLVHVGMLTCRRCCLLANGTTGLTDTTRRPGREEIPHPC